MPAVSIIMPVYNKATYLSKTLASVQAQTFANYELILVNDGSTDGSLVVASRFAEKDSRIRVIDIPNGGVSHARNIGLHYAKGEYITFIDADDTVHPLYIENLYVLLQESQADMVISGVAKCFGDSAEQKMVGKYQGLKTIDVILADFAVEQRQCGIYGSCVAKMFPAKLISDIRFDETLSLAEDFDFYLKLYSKVKCIYIDKKTYYFYLQDAENSTGNIADDKIDYIAQHKISLRYRNFLQKMGHYTGKNKEIVDYQIINYLYLSLFYAPIDQLKVRYDILKRSEIGDIAPIVTGTRQRIVLGCFTKNYYALLKIYIVGYRCLRKYLRP